jgi:pimeloyl-ACP methyl ester carboxylesterase
MNILKNHIVSGSANRPILVDAYYLPDGRPKPLVVFVHGFKGFKDWGHWHLLLRKIALEGFCCVKFNFSHNGTTPDRPDQFDDLEAFGRNTFSRELNDLKQIIDWLEEQEEIPQEELDLSQLSLIGHSRGGPIVLIQAAEDERVKAVITWASVSSLDYAWQTPGFLDDWKEKGVYHVVNGRTGQEMPLYYSLYEDFAAHRKKWTTPHFLPRLDKPGLIVHGTDDPGVSMDQALQLHQWKPEFQLHLIEGADHVFGGRHPYTQEKLSEHAAELAEVTIDFLEKNNKPKL